MPSLKATSPKATRDVLFVTVVCCAVWNAKLVIERLKCFRGEQQYGRLKCSTHSPIGMCWHWAQHWTQHLDNTNLDGDNLDSALDSANLNSANLDFIRYGNALRKMA